MKALALTLLAVALAFAFAIGAMHYLSFLRKWSAMEGNAGAYEFANPTPQD